MVTVQQVLLRPLDSSDTTERATFTVVETGTSVDYLIETADRQWHAAGTEFWELLLEFREQIEADGWLICIEGSRRFVWPTGMQGDMYRGRVALDRDTLDDDGRYVVVNVLAPTEATDVTSVADQRASIRVPQISVEERARIQEIADSADYGE